MTSDHVRLTQRNVLRALRVRLRKDHAVFIELAAQMTRREVLIVPSRGVEYAGSTPGTVTKDRVFIAVMEKGAYLFPRPLRTSVGYLQSKLGVENDADATNITCLINALFSLDLDKYMDGITLNGDYVDTTLTPNYNL
jgi:hypothetical protein